MSALAPRNSYRIADEREWLESSDSVDLSPASVWAPDYEDEDETTLQGGRVDAQYIDLMSPNMEMEGLLVDTPRQVRILDESQVLSGEASFATVNLNQPSEESVLKPQNSWEPISTTSVDDYRERRSASRVQLLDESKVLAGEASFATAMPGQRTKAHSPITEFLVKTKLSLKQLVMAMLAVVLVLALAMIVLVRTMNSEVVTVSSAPPPTTLDTASQSVSTSITESPESISISNSQGKVSGSVSPTQPVTTVEETQNIAETRLSERPSSDDARKTPSSDVRSGAVRETKKQAASVAKKAVKKQAVVNTPKASVRSEPRESRPEPAIRKSELPVTVANVETKAPATGGGERPRTVTRKPIP